MHIARQLQDYAAHWVVRKGVPDGDQVKRSGYRDPGPRQAGKALAGTLTTADDVARPLRYADEVDVQAADLDRRANEEC